MNDIKVTDKYTYQKMPVNITEEIKHFRYNGIDGEYIIKDSIYETDKYLQYGDLSAVTTNVLYKGKLGSLEVEYNYGDGGYPEYLKVNLDGISGTATGTKVDLNGDIKAEVIKRIEDITGFEIKEEAL
jgi:hypothetical protein